MITDLLVEITAPFVLCFLAYPLAHRVFRSKEQNSGEVLVASFILSFLLIILLPYGVGVIIGGGFALTSWVIYLLGIFSITFSIKWFFKDIQISLKKVRSAISRLQLLDMVFVLILIGFLFKYIYYLSVRAVTDWDATTGYLVYSKAISLSDHVPLTAFDFSRYTKPMGISFLYSWIYSLGTSVSEENFRLIPIAFIIVTLLLIYLITKALSSPSVAKIAVMIYMFLPLQDSILYYCAYYPDIAFYALILSVFYFLYKYVNTLEIKFCLISGLGLGLSLVLKAQTALFFVPILLVFVVLSNKKLIRVVMPFALSFAFLVFLILTSSGSASFSKILTTESFLALALIATLSSIVAFAVQSQNKTFGYEKLSILPVKGLFLFLGASCIALVWYLRNYLTMGTFIWLSSIKEPNLQWSIGILSDTAVKTPSQPQTLLLFVGLSILVHAILGSAWLVPRIIGLAKVRGNKHVLLIHIWVLGLIIAYILYAFNGILFSSFTLNPRDLVSLAPFFSIYGAFGLIAIAKYFSRTKHDLVILCLLLFFGVVSLTQSLLMLYYPPSFLYEFFNQTAKLSLSSWSSLAHGPPEVALNWLLFGVAVSSFLLIPLVFLKSAKHFLHRKTTEAVICNDLRKSVVYKKVIVFLLISVSFLTLLIVPYVALTYQYGDGNIFAFKENQERMIYNGLYTDILPYLRNNTSNGDVILTVGTGNTGLQYKLDSVKFVDLTFPDNLAAVRSLVDSNSTEDIAAMLHTMHVRYFLFPLGGGYGESFVGWLFNNSHLIHAVLDQRFAVLKLNSGGWVLFEITNRNPANFGWEQDDFTEYKFSETNPRVIVDDGQESFWTGDLWGNGSISVPLITTNLIEKQSGAESGQITVGNGNGSRWRIYHSYTEKQDWGQFEAVSLYWFGANTSKTLNIYIDAANSTNRWIRQITENWLGWKRLVIPLGDFIKIGFPSKNEVKEVSIGFYNEDNVSGTWLIDRAIVDADGRGDWIFTNNPQAEGLDYNFVNYTGVLNLTVWGREEGFASFQNKKIPALPTSEFHYVLCVVKGTENARWLFRLFSSNGTSYDFPWWGAPTADWKLYLFDLSTIAVFQNTTLRNDAYLALKTTDGKPASIYIDLYQIRAG